MTYKINLEIFEDTWIHHSAQGRIHLYNKDGKIIDTAYWNDLIEIPYKIRELLKKHEMPIRICDSNGNHIGFKYTHLGKKRPIGEKRKDVDKKTNKKDDTKKKEE